MTVLVDITIMSASSILPVAGVAPPTFSSTSTSTSTAGSSPRLIGLKDKRARLTARIATVSHDATLDTEARTTELAHLAAQQVQLDAQIQRLEQQAHEQPAEATAEEAPPTAEDAEAAAADGQPHVHVIA